MTSYRYNRQINPPAPFVHVTVQHPEGGMVLADIPAQLDTAADITVLPTSLVKELQLVQLDAIAILAFGATRKIVPTFLVRLALRGQASAVIEVLSDAKEPHILLGRDLLNRYRIVLDGPRGMLEID
ncbi:MAG: hypothetical protein FJ403_00605 [Verrucomicrobia bacterium]|nr:hypothetical protein [Verrucomicrobiota bacterium]